MPLWSTDPAADLRGLFFKGGEGKDRIKETREKWKTKRGNWERLCSSKKFLKISGT